LVPPEIAVALQWHTRVKYLTDMPVAFAVGFLAISKRTFDRLSAEDQSIVNEVLARVYFDMDQKAPAESANAIEALLKIGIKNVEPEKGQFDELQTTMSEFNHEMAVDGAYPVELYEEMIGYLTEFRNAKGGVAKPSGN